jgi:hypothetical protein
MLPRTMGIERFLRGLVRSGEGREEVGGGLRMGVLCD